MSSISMVTQQTYVCNITYHPLQAPTSVVNIASYTSRISKAGQIPLIFIALDYLSKQYLCQASDQFLL